MLGWALSASPLTWENDCPRVLGITIVSLLDLSTWFVHISLHWLLPAAPRAIRHAVWGTFYSQSVLRGKHGADRSRPFEMLHMGASLKLKGTSPSK